jgi:hypothetical protein
MLKITYLKKRNKIDCKFWFFEVWIGLTLEQQVYVGNYEKQKKVLSYLSMLFVALF